MTPPLLHPGFHATDVQSAGTLTVVCIDRPDRCDRIFHQVLETKVLAPALFRVVVEGHSGLDGILGFREPLFRGRDVIAAIREHALKCIRQARERSVDSDCTKRSSISRLVASST